MKLIYIASALATFVVAFLYGANAHAGYDYWNNSGFSISHQFYPGRHSYFNYAPSYYGINRYYSVGSGPSRHGAAEVEDTPASIDWAKKCSSSCLDLSGR